MAPGGTHPTYSQAFGSMFPGLGGPYVHIGDEVSSTYDEFISLGIVTEIHGETFGDGTGDTITVIPAAVTLSTGDRYPVADLVLLRRAEA